MEATALASGCKGWRARNPPRTWSAVAGLVFTSLTGVLETVQVVTRWKLRAPLDQRARGYSSDASSKTGISSNTKPLPLNLVCSSV